MTITSRKNKIIADTGLPVGQMVGMVLAEARERQRSAPGTRIEETVLRHLVGAKLRLALGEGAVPDRPRSSAESELEIGDSIIHVTAAPSEALIRKCRANIDASRRPFIVCPADKALAALQLAQNEDLEARIDVYAAEDFIGANVNKIGKFATEGLRTTIRKLFDTYNSMILQHEVDPSLQIRVKTQA